MKQTANNKQSAVQQLAAAYFTSPEALIQYLDELLERLAWAYAGKRQHSNHMVYDYDLIKQLSQAIEQDLQGATVSPNPPIAQGNQQNKRGFVLDWDARDFERFGGLGSRA